MEELAAIYDLTADKLPLAFTRWKTNFKKKKEKKFFPSNNFFIQITYFFSAELYSKLVELKLSIKELYIINNC